MNQKKKKKRKIWSDVLIDLKRKSFSRKQANSNREFREREGKVGVTDAFVSYKKTTYNYINMIPI